MRININQSLNLLKELEVRLKNQHSDKTQARRIKTQQNQIVPKNVKPWLQFCVEAYEQNQMQLKKQNRQLKRYVNKLIKMNDYLKNRLVMGKHFAKMYQKNSVNEEKDVRMLMIQVQYFKQLNRQKQLQIYILKQNQKSTTKKKSIFTEFTQQTCSSQKLNTAPRHKRQVSSKSSIMKKSDLKSSLIKTSSSKKKSKCRLCYN